MSSFEAIVSTELTTTNIDQGHIEISSFGFGGTNTHGILWGENRSLVTNPNKFWQKQLGRMRPPEIRALSVDPAHWDTDLPDQVAKPGEVWSVSVQAGALDNTTMKWEKTEEAL